MKLETKMGRTYRIMGWNREDFAMVPEESELFGNLSDERDFGRTNVLIYTSDERIDTPNDLSVSLAYALSGINDFNVYLSSERNAEISNYADVVITGFGLRGIERELEEYDDGSKVFVGPQELSGIRSKGDLARFVKVLKRAVRNKADKREVLVG